MIRLITIRLRARRIRSLRVKRLTEMLIPVVERRHPEMDRDECAQEALKQARWIVKLGSLAANIRKHERTVMKVCKMVDLSDDDKERVKEMLEEDRKQRIHKLIGWF